ARRLPYFCAGCPHNRSTVVPEGSEAQAGIGCHFMASWMNRHTGSLIQMGGEGVNWVAKSRFTGGGHIFQNLGEGTWFHSGSLAIRQAIAAGANINYKILFNDAVAMTGGQPVDGRITVPGLVAQLRAEGVHTIAVLGPDPAVWHRHDFPHGVDFRHRDDLDAVQRELREVPGVTALVYDHACATETRRKRKRGLAPPVGTRLLINEAVCEGCGDCGVQSNCVAIQPQDTALGRKRRIDQGACNADYSCLQGFCPSFVGVQGARLRRTVAPAEPFAERLAALEQPLAVPLDRVHGLLLAGVGGTGVVTVGALVAMAAHLEGKGSAVLDFTGFAQKGGSVLSYVRIARSPAEIHQVRIDRGAADALVACDLLVGTDPRTLTVLGRERTRVLANSFETPGGDFVLSPDADMAIPARIARLREAVGNARVGVLDATRLAERLCGDAVFANVLMLGCAWQLGMVPVSGSALDRAIALNGAAVEGNRRAFGWGRLAAVDPHWVLAQAGLEERPPRAQPLEALIR
ncbi:MAG: 2-oxoacid:acceptor oxidoreductase family protein, partial [Gammaproteobacteria bacterium]